ncbi:MAG: 2-hydroxyacid dehydrogenase [Candidatus Aenigmatarchaeota archaeon]
MKFRKMLMIGIDESKFDPEYWNKISLLSSEGKILPKDSHEIRKELTDTDCLLLGFGININREDIDNAPNLKYIGVLATAYGKVDIDYARSKGVTVCNIPGYSTEAVAEFVLAAILENIRCLEEGKQRGIIGNYSETGISASEIKDKIFGIVGLGRIGGRVAELALGFGADVRYWSRNRKGVFENKGIKYEDADSLIPKCDFLSLNLAQTNETEKFLNEELIKKVKSGAIVINTAPMELVDIDALADRLEKGDITFILDHSDETPPEQLKKLSKYKNCIIYPPIAYITAEARIAKQDIFLSNLENFLKGTPTNEVN